ncbi:MAG: hypothetical protein P8Z80_00475 [Pseudolabrys sp.]
MSKQSIALAYSRPSDTLGETEYRALVQVLSESARGRAFLEEHARRSRSAETKILLTAIERIEAQVRPRPPDPVYNDLGQVLEELRTARARIESGGKVAQADQLGALLELLLRRITKMLPPLAAQAKRLAPPKPAAAPAAAPRPAAARWLEEPLVPPPAVNDALPHPSAGGIAAKVPATPRPAPAVARRAPAPTQPAPARPASAVAIEDEIKVLVDAQVESRAKKAPAPVAAPTALVATRAITAKEALAAIMALSEEERIALFS